VNENVHDLADVSLESISVAACSGRWGHNPAKNKKESMSEVNQKRGGENKSQVEIVKTNLGSAIVSTPGAVSAGVSEAIHNTANRK
jgi:hypothetical protein